MKIRELETADKILYNRIISSAIWWRNDGFDLYPWRHDREISYEEKLDLEVSDLFDLFDDATIMRCTRGLGKIGLARLKELSQQ